MDLRTSGSSNSSVPQVALLGCLMQIGKQVPELAWILDAQERHLVTGNESLRIGQVLAERVVVPGDIGILHRWLVSIAGHAAGLAPNDAVQAGTNQVLPGLETVADLALIEYCAPRCASPGPWACATRANGSSAAVPLNMLDSFITPLPHVKRLPRRGRRASHITPAAPDARTLWSCFGTISVIGLTEGREHFAMRWSRICYTLRVMNTWCQADRG